MLAAVQPSAYTGSTHLLGRADVRSRDSLLTFDLLRLLSAAAVAFGHCWAMYDDNKPLMIGQVRVGRSGVAILCAIGGYFAFLKRSGPSLPWLRKRFSRLYPP